MCLENTKIDPTSKLNAFELVSLTVSVKQRTAVLEGR